MTNFLTALATKGFSLSGYTLQRTYHGLVLVKSHGDDREDYPAAIISESANLFSYDDVPQRFFFSRDILAQAAQQQANPLNYSVYRKALRDLDYALERKLDLGPPQDFVDKATIAIKPGVADRTEEVVHPAPAPTSF